MEAPQRARSILRGFDFHNLIGEQEKQNHRAVTTILKPETKLVGRVFSSRQKLSPCSRHRLLLP